MRESESFLRRLEETLSRMVGWLAARRRGSAQAGAHEGRAPLETLRREIASVRRSLAETARADLARARASMDDLQRDYDVPPQHTALTRAELEALRRHLQTTAHLLGDLSNLDSPAWNRAHEEYDRSWDDVERAFESGGRPASP